MDPLSAAASVIAIATVAGQVGKAFAELRKDCSELPGRLHALSNEITDIEFVLHQVAAVLQELIACLITTKNLYRRCSLRPM